MAIELKEENPPEEEPLQGKETKEDNDYTNKTIYGKLCYLKTNITVEPMMAGLVIPSTLSRLATQNLNLEKTCRLKLNLGQAICDALIRREGNLTTEEAEVQKIISSIETWKSVIQTAIPMFLVIFMGAWSDRTGNRKLCILLPIIGEFLVCLCNIISTFFFNEIPVEVTMLCEGLFPAVTGGWVLVYLGVFSYISDITTPKTRTFRVGLVNIFLTAGIPIGTALSGILLRLLGYYGIFGISGSIYLLTLTYGIVYLKRNTKPNNEDNKVARRTTFWDILYLVKETIAVVFKKRDGNFRKKIILTLLVVAIVYGPNHGERIVFYFYLRYRLHWDAFKYSIYSTYSIIMHTLGAIFSITVLSKWRGYHDSVLCLISVISKLAGSIAILFVYTDLDMFMIPIVEILNATTFTSLRSMASKLVPSEEMGKMNSLFSLVETTAALMFDPTYSRLYSRTVDTFAGAVFVFSALMTLPVIGLLVWFFVQHRIEAGQRWRQANAESDEVVNEKTCASEMYVKQRDVYENN